ncbi:huntingtin-interacting protein [Tritrichomonas foetus]|uniref:Huntingtin-interacting protein n=1 Tax=Tritrichomonas foetus TaxID=1144522 RepID=A0A1J4JP32_9EUKA|nr:huntingtin-interacting protein [Tritrichomonas foetus]|eukprot:OHT00881.1 huntingtin-interacting protein [Tritrichomonas foetus]
MSHSRSSDKKALDEFALMRQIYDNLQYLDYESEFDPISRHFPYLTPYYFALPGQSGKEQFDYFAALAIWLMQKYHKSDIATPSDYDDPSQVADNIILALPSIGFKLSSASNKLVPGHGLAVCTILDALLRLTIKKQHFSPNSFRVVSGIGGKEEAETVGGSDEDDDGIIDDAIDVQSDDDGDTFQAVDYNNDQQNKVIDSLELKAEAERVAARLQIRIPSTKSDWRSHFAQMNQHHARINEIMGQLSPILTKVGTDVTKAIEAIQTREKNLNARFETSVSEYAARASALAEVEKKHSERVAEVNKLQEELNTVVNKLSSTKESLNEKQKEASDNSPLMKMKSAINKLRDDIKALELQSAILQRSLTQSWLEENEITDSAFE